MSPVRSLLAAFRRPLLREIGFQLGLLAVALQVGLTVLHVAPAIAGAIGGTALEAAWCGTPEHAPAVPAATHARDVCPLCQLPSFGPVPALLPDTGVGIRWQASTVAYFGHVHVDRSGQSVGPIQPRGPPPVA